MHYDFEHVALDVTHVLVDETTCNFENRGLGITLSIMSEPPELKMTPQAVIDELTRSLAGSMGPLFKTEGQNEVFLGQSAHRAAYDLGPGARLKLLFPVSIGP
jgi:hypothetical protein